MSPWISPEWSAPSRVRAVTTLRYGAGISKPPFDSFNLGNFQAADADDPSAVQHNRSELIDRLALPSAPHWLRQVHGTHAVRIDPAKRVTPKKNNAAGHAYEADASVTSETNVVLAVLTADCLPVVFAADDADEIAVAHAGWRGLAEGVIENTLIQLQTAAERLHVWLGPAAGPRAYEVGEDVFDAFTRRSSNAASAFVATRAGHWHVDLYALARLRLEQAGVHRISGGNFCTISDSMRFYSHRRESPTGRMATLVYLAH